MPHFTLTIEPSGLLVNAIISVSGERQEALHQAQHSVPTPVTVRAMIDTGASSSCVDPKITKQLELTPTGKVSAHTPSTKKDKPHEVDQFDIGIFIPGGSANVRPFNMPTLPVLEFDLDHQGFQVIIGRDILASCILIYEGQGSFFTLAY